MINGGRHDRALLVQERVAVSALHVPPVGCRRWPFAVGAVVHAEPPEGTARDETWADRHLAVALAAYHAGYFLIATLDVGPVGGVTDTHRAQLRALALRTDAEAIFVLGLDPPEQVALESLAADLRLVLHGVEPVD